MSENVKRKVRITIVREYEFDPANYNTVHEEDGIDTDLTEEQQGNLTPEQMLKYDEAFLKAGDFSLEEFLGYSDVAEDEHVKLELIPEGE